MEEDTPRPPAQEPPPYADPAYHTEQDQGRYAPPGELSIGSVLSRSFSMLMKNPALFFGLAILAGIPGVVIEALADGSGFGSVLLSLVGSFFGVIFQGAIAYGVYRSLRGGVAGIGEAISHGMRHFIPLVIAALILGIGIGIGTMLLIVPGLILMCVWAVTIPACVVEKLGPIDSLSRSAQLTKGYRWKIFGLIVLVALISFGLTFIMIMAVSALSGTPTLAGIAACVIAMLPAAFQNVMMATLYYDLRAIKEGVSVDRLANVFD